MAERCLLYYITDRSAFPGDEPTRRKLLLEKIAEAAAAGVEYIQLREKDLTTRELEILARQAVSTVRDARSDDPKIKTQLLLNSRTDVALAVAADGVHLRAQDISPQDVRGAWKRSSAGLDGNEKARSEPVISVSCHSPEEISQAASNHATLALFAPVFEKKDFPDRAATGLLALQLACRSEIPVLALGGVSLQNAELCLRSGARGIAGIRLFQENNIAVIASTLRHFPRSGAV